MNALANALIVVDVQVDFCPGGSLAVEHGDEVAAKISAFMDAKSDEYLQIVATKCWHPSPEDVPHFDHFSDKPNFVNTWPPHCVAGTEGANFHPNLGAMEITSYRNLHGVRPTPVGDLFEFDKIFYKGQATSAYSGFEGYDQVAWEGGFDAQPLDVYLKLRKAGHLDIVGIATDYCVFSTAMDGVRLGYDTTVLVDLTAGVNRLTTLTAMEQMQDVGIHLEMSDGKVPSDIE